jgi:hypothetical protein
LFFYTPDENHAAPGDSILRADSLPRQPIVGLCLASSHIAVTIK